MLNKFKGDAHLYIWKEDKSKYIPLYRDNFNLVFQPYKGLKVSLDSNIYIIHDISWDLEENKFNLVFIQIEYFAGESFIDLEFLIDEAELVGWSRLKGKDVKEILDPDDSFKSYCFS